MQVTQTIRLDDNEKEILEKAFELIDRISDITKTSMNNVFDYLTEQADIRGQYDYILDNLIDLSDL